MSFSTLRTTYDAEELKRHANAPNKICGLYEQLGNYKPVFGSSYSPTYKDGTEKSNEGTIDSGLGDELPDEEFLNGPPKPKLLGSAAVDSENHDSGLGPETEDMDTNEDDDLEKDRVAVSQPVKLAQQPKPRMPKVNHSFTKTTRRSPPTVHTTTVTPSAHTYTTTETLHSLKLRQAQQQQNVNLEIQQKLFAYLLPNKDGDT